MDRSLRPFERHSSFTPLTAACVAGLSLASVAATSPSVCPDLTANESAADCPWAATARLLRGPVAHMEDLRPALTRFAPALAAELAQDAQDPRLYELWGQSLNFDEHAKKAIIDDAVVDALLALANGPPRKERVVHAGIAHTYGYLFSLLSTPYGYKRARWVKGELEEGFGLPAGSLGPLPKEGTLLANVTYFFGRIAFRASVSRLEELEHAAEHASPSVRRFDYAALAVTRLEEMATVGNRTVTFTTDLVAFSSPAKPAPGHGNTHLLVYAVDDAAVGAPRLVTGFPVDATMVATVIEAGEGSAAVKSRYNAFVPGMSSESVPGSRRLTTVAPR